MLWVVSNALTIAIECIKQNTNQINHDNTARKELIFQRNGALKHTLDMPAKQMFEITKNLDIINGKLHWLQHQTSSMNQTQQNDSNQHRPIISPPAPAAGRLAPSYKGRKLEISVPPAQPN